jgi:hypothetical protein
LEEYVFSLAIAARARGRILREKLDDVIFVGEQKDETGRRSSRTGAHETKIPWLAIRTRQVEAREKNLAGGLGHWR